MPHLTLEYTDNLNDFDAPRALLAVNGALAASGLFADADIKSRAHRLSDYRIGTAEAERAFVHIRIALLGGRSEAQRKALADATLGALQEAMGKALERKQGREIQLSVETVDIDPASYAKAVCHD